MSAQTDFGSSAVTSEPYARHIAGTPARASAASAAGARGGHALRVGEARGGRALLTP